MPDVCCVSCQNQASELRRVHDRQNLRSSQHYISHSSLSVPFSSMMTVTPSMQPWKFSIALAPWWPSPEEPLLFSWRHAPSPSVSSWGRPCHYSERQIKKNIIVKSTHFLCASRKRGPKTISTCVLVTWSGGARRREEQVCNISCLLTAYALEEMRTKHIGAKSLNTEGYEPKGNDLS